MDELELAEKTRLKVQAIANGEAPMPAKPPTRSPEPDPKFTPSVRNKILSALAGNHFMQTATALAGIESKRVYVWLRRGARDARAGIDSEYATFAADVERAMATGEGKMLKKIVDSAERGDTGDAKWILERRHSDRWAKRDKVEVGGDPNQPIVVQLTWPGQPQPAEMDAIEMDDGVIDAEVVEDGDY